MSLFKQDAIKKALKRKEKAKAHTILIVDDEEHNLITLADLLSDEYEILTAPGGLEALELIRQEQNAERIHLIISDQRMPNVTGVEFLHESITLLPKAKRILLTGFTDVEAIIDSINKGQIFKFVLKPFDHRDMLMTVRLAIETYRLENQNDRLVRELQTLNASLERKVDERTAELQEALQELSELNASKDRFFSVLAHDLKNPLHAFILTAEAIVEDIEFFSKSDIARLASNLYRGSQNLYRLLENLLYWAQRQLQEGTFHPTDFGVGSLVSQTIEIVEDHAHQKNIRIDVEIDAGLQAHGDKNMIEVVLRNLLSNAIKFSFAGSEIKVAASLDDTDVKIEVIDQGTGIAPEGLGNIFRIDKQFSTRGTNDEKGTGLGLILCKELVVKNGGEIRVESELEKGTTFTFTLPMVQG